MSRHQKYFLQLVACGKKPSALHLNAEEDNLMVGEQDPISHLDQSSGWSVELGWSTSAAARALLSSSLAEASVVEVGGEPPLGS